MLQSRGTRETIESIVLAVILAFIFRSFEAEAFVIPTGSMAPTLMGRNVDVYCDQCGYRYSSGASSENPTAPEPGTVVQTTCPICRYPKELAREENNQYDGEPDPNQSSFNGDRLVVDKVTYLLSAPKRWDVIVFKYPYNPKQNYIKRLVGLPGETLRIHNGDIFSKPAGESEFKICRKPPHKLRALLQIVHDSEHIPTALIEAKGPSRWQQWSKVKSDRLWKIDREENRETYSITNPTKDIAWLSYRHLLPSLTVSSQDTTSASFEWHLPESNSELQGQLITDFYPYNQNTIRLRELPVRHVNEKPGYHWAGDLAVECDADIESSSGELLLQLVEGGIKYTCTIDVSSGKATLSVQSESSHVDEPVRFVDESGKSRKTISAQTEVHGAGSYRLRFANADDELTLWVDEHVVQFDHPAQFQSPSNLSPRWTPEEPLDAEPIRIGSKNCVVTIDRLKVLRDLYYIALKSPPMLGGGLDSMDYSPGEFQSYIDEFNAKATEYEMLRRQHAALLNTPLTEETTSQIRKIDEELQRLEIEIQAAVEGPVSEVRATLTDPRLWNDTKLFTTRRHVDFKLEEGQYLPMGDNSPSSKDGRIWGPEHYVDEDWLIGKAEFVFWPHSWRRPIPYWPNFNRFRFVR